MVDLAVTIAATLFLGVVALSGLALIGAVLAALWDAMFPSPPAPPAPRRPRGWEERL